MRRPLTTATSIPRIKEINIQHQVGYAEFVQQLLEAAKERSFIQLSQRTIKNCEPNAQHQSLDLTQHISKQHSATTSRAHSRTYIEMDDRKITSPESRRKAIDESQDEVQYTINDAAGHVNEAFSTLNPRPPSPVDVKGQKKNAIRKAKEITNIAGRKARRDTTQDTTFPIVIQQKEKTLIEAQAEHLMTTRSSVAALVQSPLETREKEKTARHRTMGQSGDDDQTMVESAGEGAGGGTCEGVERKGSKPDSFPRAPQGASPKTSIPETATRTSPDALQRAASKRSTPGTKVLQEKVLDERTLGTTPTKNRPRKKRLFAQAFGIFKTPTQGHLVSSDIESSDAEDGHDVHSIIKFSDRVPQLPLQPTPELQQKRGDKDQNDSQDAVVYATPKYSEWTVAGKGLAPSGDVQSSRLFEHNSIDTIREEAEVKRSELVSRADIMASAESAVAHIAQPRSTSKRKRDAKDVMAEGTRRSKRRKQDGGEGEVNNLVGTGRIVVAVLIDDQVDLSGYKRADRQGQENDGAF